MQNKPGKSPQNKGSAQQDINTSRTAKPAWVDIELILQKSFFLNGS
tara:strand:+ start:541 stop:678 length:138 start_codon:yes stop_codon:yes gene_type:complete